MESHCSITTRPFGMASGDWTCRSSWFRRSLRRNSWSTAPNSRSSSAHNFHRREADPHAFRDSDLQRNALFERFHMTDHANHFAARVQRIERVERNLQRLAVERAETFIEEQRVDGRLETHQIGQSQRQRKTHQEAFTAR